ncbi:hypothetical protein QAD02_000747 [Eretmocerus hayati]|uniref:Uncharacterized protein n=1 Tax=Eretmocerus hayati TaxID=131215 RepID=A0ACC2NEA8_9HYME|nr:hypothetical protein QAD02_000747 [Eretmocerus hayati]
MAGVSEGIHRLSHEYIQDWIRAGLDINQSDNSGYTLLVRAVDAQDLHLTKLILSYGADPEAGSVPSDRGRPIRVAAELGNADIVECLCRHGASPRRIEECPNLMRDLLEHREFGVIRVLLKAGLGPNIDIIHWSFEEKLLVAVTRFGHGDSVHQLLNLNADVNGLTENGRTGIFVAVENQNERLVQKYINFGANVHHQDNDGVTLLSHALRNKHTRIIQKLIDAGID